MSCPSFCQDPHFTQFISSPLIINPANTGWFSGKVRLQTNYRHQWNNMINPYVTSSLSVDIRTTKDDEYTRRAPNFGLQFINDKTMKGAFLSNYLSASISYFVPVDQDGYSNVGGGLSASFGSRKIDFSSISFDRQFTTSGYNLGLPSGEGALGNMKPFFSISSGLLYAYANADEGKFYEFGVSAYHVNRPKQTFLNDPNQFLPMRFSAHAIADFYTNEKNLIGLRFLYQNQASVNYILAGASFKRALDDELKKLVGAGLSYRVGDAIAPSIFVDYNNLQIGMSYDIVTSTLKTAYKHMSAMELSIRFVGL